MIRTTAWGLVVAAGLGLALQAGCKSKKNDEPASSSGGPSKGPPVTPPPDAGKAGYDPTKPDLGYEARRDELLRRGNPEMMKPAPSDDGKAPEVDPATLIKPISKDVLMVGQIRVDLAKGTAEVPAKVVLQTGMLEYIAVAPNGKTYESMLSVEASSVELRLALTLLGFDGTVPDDQGVLAAPTDADTVLLRVRLPAKRGKKGKAVERPLSALLVSRKTGKPLDDLPWQVVGFADANRDSALRSPDLLTLVSRDINAPLRIGGDAGNPYAGPDQGVGTNPDVVPPVGTALTLVIARRPESPPIPPAPSSTSLSPTSPSGPTTP